MDINLANESMPSRISNLSLRASLLLYLKPTSRFFRFLRIRQRCLSPTSCERLSCIRWPQKPKLPQLTTVLKHTSCVRSNSLSDVISSTWSYNTFPGVWLAWGMPQLGWNRGEDKVDQAQTHLLQVSIWLWRVFIIRFSQDASVGCSSTQRIPIELQSIALVDTNSEYQELDSRTKADSRVSMEIYLQVPLRYAA